MSTSEKKKCFYYDDVLEDGCCTCCECYIEKCPEAVNRMSPEEKLFYGVE